MIPTGLHGWNLTLRHLSTNKNTFMKNNKSVFTGFVFSLLFFVINGNNAVFAQLNDTKPDTLKITLEKVEAEFLNSNLQLLASRFNISASEAEVVQAKLWNNPNISIEQNIYNQYTKKLLDFTSSGNTGIQIQQLITLAGKRNKQIKIASINKEISEYNFAEILRSLKYELRTDFYDLYFLQQSVIFYDESIPPLKKAIELIQGAYSSRSILLSEILRLKSLLLSLETDRLEIVNHISALENDLRILQAGTTQKGNYYVPEVDTASINKLSLNQLNRDEIINAALENRPEYLIAKATVKMEETNLSLQKSLAVPDLTIGGLWSRQGSYIPNYYAVTFSIDLPIFNRNQGNIAASGYNLEADKKTLIQTQLNIEREVNDAYDKVLTVDNLYKTFDKRFTIEYKSLVNGMLLNYEKRYMTVIEFTDFYESYRNSVTQLNKLFNDRVDAFENLNYTAATDIVK